MLSLALPIVIAEVGWMLMGLVDTVMVGRLPNAAVAMSAVALAQVLHNTLAFGIGGILLSLDTVIAQAHGAGRIEDAGRWLWHGLLLAVAIACFLIACLLLAPLVMHRVIAGPEVAHEAIRTLQALTPGVLPLLVYFALRRHLQAFNHVRVIAVTLISANLVNFVFDWLLLFPHDWRFSFGGGSSALHLHWQSLGPVGSGIATSLARLYQAVALTAAILWLDRRRGYGLRRISLRPEAARLRRLLRLGLPVGAMLLVEIGIFGVVTFLIGTMSAGTLAGHEVALNVVSFTFMIPLGLSAAAGVRVGQAIGRGDAAGAEAAGWAALVLSAAVMVVASAVLALFPHAIARVFTPDLAVIAATVPLFGVAAVFQLFDGVQVTALGALRGAGDTYSGLLTHLCTYWLLGMPLGIWLAFRRDWGARGLWTGLCCALVLAGSILLMRWARVSRRLRHTLGPSEPVVPELRG